MKIPVSTTYHTKFPGRDGEEVLPLRFVRSGALIFILALAHIAMFPLTATSQTTTGPELNSPRSLPADSAGYSRTGPGETNGMGTIGRLNELKNEIQRLHTSSAETNSFSNPNPTMVSPANEDPVPRFDQFRSEKRVQAINQRIDVLKELMAHQRAATEEAERKKQRELEKQREMASQLQATATPEPVATDPAPSPVKTVPDPIAASVPTTPAPETKPIADPGIQVLSTPVNSFELANSLFATGNYSQALKNYEALMADETVDVDRDWLRCLTANCYRILGDTSNAEKLYRQVAASKLGSYPPDHAKWYLDHMTQRQRIVGELQAINIELESLFPSGESK